MPDITASIPHQLTRAEAKRRIQEQIGALRKQHGAMVTNFQETWREDELDFSLSAIGQSISGHLKVDDQAVHLKIALPWLLSMLAGTIKHRIEQQGANALSLLADKKTSGK